MHIIKLRSRSPSGFDVYGIVIDNVCLAWDFISALEEKDKKQVLALLEFISTKGPPTNEEKFRSLGNDILELKTRSGIRILCFFGRSQLPKTLILAQGFFKPKKKILQREKGKALQWLNDYTEIADIKEKIIT